MIILFFSYSTVISSPLLTKTVNIPVVSNGGIGKVLQVKDIFLKTQVSGIAISSMFHYYCINKQIFNITEYEIGNLEYINKKTKFSKFETYKISSFKNQLRKFL